MDIGMLIKWGAAIPGRERDHLANYRRSVAFGRRLLAEGKLTSFEPFLLSGGDVEVEEGFFLVKGPVAEVFAILQGEEYRDIFAAATLTAQHVSTVMLTVDEAIDGEISRYEKAVAALSR